MPQTSVRTPVIAGNWKMYKTIEEACAFVETLAPLPEPSQAAVYLAVPFTAIHAVAQMEAPVIVGGQNMNDASEGAFTGEIAARMLKEAGARFVILGHSERRHIFNESSAFINKKVHRALQEELQPIVCVGETLEQRERGETEAVLEEQILDSLKGVGKREIPKLILAYEPVWAIGTGRVAHPDDAQSAHAFCRRLIAKKWSEPAAEKLVIQYGGSVKPESAAVLMAQPDIDGLLVGGASLSPQTFSEIIHGAIA